MAIRSVSLISFDQGNADLEFWSPNCFCRLEKWSTTQLWASFELNIVKPPTCKNTQPTHAKRHKLNVMTPERLRCAFCHSSCSYIQLPYRRGRTWGEGKLHRNHGIIRLISPLKRCIWKSTRKCWKMRYSRYRMIYHGWASSLVFEPLRSHAIDGPHSWKLRGQYLPLWSRPQKAGSFPDKTSKSEFKHNSG